MLLKIKKIRNHILLYIFYLKMCIIVNVNRLIIEISNQAGNAKEVNR